MFTEGIRFNLPPIGDAATLRALARWLRSHADHAEARAALLERDAERARAASDALRAVAADRAALPPEALTPDERRARRRRRLEARNILIVRCAAKGWDNARLARRFRLHPSTLSRIVQRSLRDAEPEPAP